MPVRVKICGITREQDAELAVELGAAALGFNFYPLSPRFLPAASARAIVRRLPPLVVPVGVFANETDDQRVAATAAEADATAVQLHGPKYPPLAGVLGEFRVILAVPVGGDFRPERLGEMRADAFLLDTFDARLPGGTGRAFDWALARDAGRFGRIILAGGLTPENVGEAIRQVRPFAVDVATGVEQEPGRKDPGKLRAFFQAVARAEQRAAAEEGY